MALKRLAKQLVALTPYRISRTAPNRFDAIEHFIGHIARASYKPRSIIDGGAHLGTFALTARSAFPEAEIHMVEPQPACAARLDELARRPGFHFHPVAITDRQQTVSFMRSTAPHTGAHIAWTDDQAQAGVEVQGETLDRLFADRSAPEDRILLKLDLQGHELLALQGAKRLLRHVELVLTEVSFFAQAGEPTILRLMQYLDDAGFDLFDVVGMHGRRRDDRARQGDMVFVRRQTPMWADTSWA